MFIFNYILFYGTPSYTWQITNSIATGSFLWGKAARPWRWLPTLSRAEVKQKVVLYFFSHSGPSWPVLGWPLPLPLYLQEGDSLRARNFNGGVSFLCRWIVGNLGFKFWGRWSCFYFSINFCCDINWFYLVVWVWNNELGVIVFWFQMHQTGPDLDYYENGRSILIYLLTS
jgi:hypothetical protein